MLMALVFGLLVLAGRESLGSTPAGSRGTTRDGALVLLNPLRGRRSCVAASLVWAGPATHTGGHAGDVAQRDGRGDLRQGRDGPGSSDISYRLFSSDKTTPRERLDLYVDADPRRPRRESSPRVTCSSSTRHGRAPARDRPASKAPADRAGKALDAVGSTRSTSTPRPRLACAVLMQVFLIARAGLAAAATQADASDERGPVPRVRLPRPWARSAASALIVLVPNLSVDYGVLRAFQQTLLVVAPVMAAGMWMLLRPLRRAARGARGRGARRTPARPRRCAARAPRRQPAAARAGELRHLLRPLLRLRLRDAGDDLAGAVDRRVDRANESESSPTATSASGCWRGSRQPAPVADRLYPTLLTKGAYVFVDAQILGQGVSARSSTPAT